MTLNGAKNATYLLILSFGFMACCSGIASTLPNLSYAADENSNVSAPSAVGSSTLIDVSLKPGVHYLRVTVNPAGQVVKAEKIVPLSITDGSIPAPPIPTGDFGFKEAAPVWFAGVQTTKDQKDSMAAALSVAYSTLADQIEAGGIKTPAQAAQAATQARKTVYRTVGRLRDDWTPFEEKLVAHFTSLQTSGKLTDNETVSKAFYELSSVLSGGENYEAATEAAGFQAMALRQRWQKFLSPELIELIIKLILQIISTLN